jgi:hypothetical protein
MSSEISAGPAKAPVNRELAAVKAKSALHQAIWEAAQFVTLADIERYVADTVKEIRSDEP